jgi:hypothetical protein
MINPQISNKRKLHRMFNDETRKKNQQEKLIQMNKNKLKIKSPWA